MLAATAAGAVTTVATARETADDLHFALPSALRFLT
jgi:hypothetical protein